VSLGYSTEHCEADLRAATFDNTVCVRTQCFLWEALLLRWHAEIGIEADTDASTRQSTTIFQNIQSVDRRCSKKATRLTGSPVCRVPG